MLAATVSVASTLAFVLLVPSHAREQQQQQQQQQQPQQKGEGSAGAAAATAEPGKGGFKFQQFCKVRARACWGRCAYVVGVRSMEARVIKVVTGRSECLFVDGQSRGFMLVMVVVVKVGLRACNGGCGQRWGFVLVMVAWPKLGLHACNGGVAKDGASCL